MRATRDATGARIRDDGQMSRFPPDTIGFKTSPQNAEWPVLDETWAAAAELRAFSAGWMNDHLTDLSADGGPSFEALTLMAALAHRVPGVWVGHAVLSNTFRHPAALAKADPSIQTIQELLATARARIERLTPHAAFAELSAGALVVDTRCAEARQAKGTIPGSVHVPLSVLFWRLDPTSGHNDSALSD